VNLKFCKILFFQKFTTTCSFLFFFRNIWAKLIGVSGGRVNTTRLEELAHGVGYRVTEARKVDTTKYDKEGVIVELGNNLEVFLPSR
jgi:hypothetical protein